MVCKRCNRGRPPAGVGHINPQSWPGLVPEPWKDWGWGGGDLSRPGGRSQSGQGWGVGDRSGHYLEGAGASEKSCDPQPRRPEALSWGRSLPGARVSRTVRTGVCSRRRSRSQRPGEFLLAVEGLKGRLAPGFRMWVRSGGEKGAPGCAPPQLCGRTWEPVEGAGGTSSLNFPTPGSSALKPGGSLRTGRGGAATRPAGAEGEWESASPAPGARTRDCVSRLPRW